MFRNNLFHRPILTSRPLAADLLVIIGVLALLALLGRVGAGLLVSFNPPQDVPSISLDPANLPYYAARSTLRMFIALGFSFLFTLIYAYAAAHSRIAEKILIPLLDILQSVPVLGFLAVTISAFIALFPGSLLGLEAASVFAIFTSQVWNMIFSFYQSLRAIPRELDEAAALYRLPAIQRFFRVELPTGMIGLVWNAMMSFGGGWFFVAASEAISVLNRQYTLPGIGAYVTEAVQAEDFRALFFALLMMAAVILLVDQFFWKPLIAWSNKFKLERSAAAQAPTSWVLNLLRASRLPRLLAGALTPFSEAIGNALARRFPARPATPQKSSGDSWASLLILLPIIAIALVADYGVRMVVTEIGLTEIALVIVLGFFTFGRVVVLVIISSLIWVPVGVAIGFNPRLTRLVQPIVQFLASFPANFLFPFATLFFINAHVNINIGGILLMALGSQWYILFNTIAGAMSIPNELREMTINLGVGGGERWRSLILPGIFSAWVTGGITAAGGAWNASIVSEIVSWGSTTLTATGLGAYVAQVTQAGDWARIVLGVSIMSLYVVGVNRIFWQRLYQLAERKYRLA